MPLALVLNEVLESSDQEDTLKLHVESRSFHWLCRLVSLGAGLLVASDVSHARGSPRVFDVMSLCCPARTDD